jgi:hypothetical protein
MPKVLLALIAFGVFVLIAAFVAAAFYCKADAICSLRNTVTP